jgi:uncharacterized protein YlxW (UPF0749 family)
MKDFLSYILLYFVVFFKFKLLEKEKRQLEIKLDKLDKLSRALQQERTDLQTTIKNLSKSATAVPSPSSVLTTITSSTEDNPTTREFLFPMQEF